MSAARGSVIVIHPPGAPRHHNPLIEFEKPRTGTWRMLAFPADPAAWTVVKGLPVNFFVRCHVPIIWSVTHTPQMHSRAYMCPYSKRMMYPIGKLISQSEPLTICPNRTSRSITSIRSVTDTLPY